MEFSVIHGFQNIFAQHQIRHIGARNNHAMLAGQSLTDADIEEALDFFVNTADRLNLAKLINRAGYGNALFNRNAGNGRQQTVIFG